MAAYIYDDGGRAESGRRGQTGDCVIRAIAIAAKRPYSEVYYDMKRYNHEYAKTHHDSVAKNIRNYGASPRRGMFKKVYQSYLQDLGFTWHPTMGIGKGAQIHLRQDELPAGRLLVQVSKHMVAVIDGVIHDVFDPTREGTRCVYGYWSL